MTDETKPLSTAPRSRARRFDAPRFSRSAQEADFGDMLSLIQDTPDAEMEDGAPQPAAPPTKKPPQSAEDAQPAEPTATGPDFLHDYLRELQWSESDIARLLVGPALSHHTAEGLFRQHAANTPQDQALLIEALQRAGAAKVPRDPSLLSGLIPNHLLPDQPADLAQIVSQFAQLPDVQKRRFLALLDESPPSINPSDSATPRNPPTGAKAGPGNPTQKTAPSQSAPTDKREPAAKGDDVLNTVLKGSFDTLGTLIKGLLGDGRSGKGLPSPKGSPPPDKKAPPASEDEPATPTGDEPSDSSSKKDRPNPRSPAESDDSGGSDSSDSDSNDSPDSDSSDSDSDSDSNSNSDDTPYGPPAPEDLPADLGGDREPD
jgi:hypothetical protein